MHLCNLKGGDAITINVINANQEINYYVMGYIHNSHESHYIIIEYKVHNLISAVENSPIYLLDKYTLVLEY